MADNFAAMETDAARALTAEFGSGELFFEHHAEMRYRGQRHNIKIPVSGLKSSTAVRAAFEQHYQRRYGHADSNAPAEFQTLHLSGFARLQQPDIARLPRANDRVRTLGSRQVYIASAGGWLDAQIFNRVALPVGFAESGPAVIEEYGSTTLIWPGDRFEIGALHEIRIQCAD